ncbi:MAG: glycosyltransferase family 4 protein [Saprospiraceae bacterium]
MRILIVSNSAWNIRNFRGGLIRHLISVGHEVWSLCPEDTVTLIELESLGCQVMGLRNVDARGKNPIRDLKLLLELKSAFFRIMPDLIISFTPKINIYSGMAAARLRISLIGNITGMGSTFSESLGFPRYIQSLYRMAMRRAQFVAFHNQDDLQYFLEHGLIQSNQGVHIPGSGVNTEEFAPVRRIESVRRFLFIGRILPEKGIVPFLEAALSLHSIYPEVQWKVVGYRGETWIKGLIDRCSGCSAISIEKFTDNSREEFEWTDAFVLLSRREGLSRALLEAMSMQRIPIVSNVPGCRDVVEHNLSGIVMHSQDTAALVQQMEELIRMDADSVERMSKAARARIIQSYADTMIHAKYDQLIQSLATNSVIHG